jgi:hypothetical protein
MPATRPPGGLPVTARHFRLPSTRILYLQLTVDQTYLRYCNSLLRTNGVNGFEVTTVKTMTYRRGEDFIGWITHPDNFVIQFGVRDETSAKERTTTVKQQLKSDTQREIRTSRADRFEEIGRGLGYDAIGSRYAVVVAGDLEAAATNLVERLKISDRR